MVSLCEVTKTLTQESTRFWTELAGWGIGFELEPDVGPLEVGAGGATVIEVSEIHLKNVIVYAVTIVIFSLFLFLVVLLKKLL